MEMSTQEKPIMRTLEPVIAEQRFHTAQVTELLLADRADEHDVAYRLDFVRVERPQHG